MRVHIMRFNLYKILKAKQLSRLKKKKHISGCLKMKVKARRLGGKDYKRIYKETFESDGNVHYLDCDDGFLGSYYIKTLHCNTLNMHKTTMG